MFMYYETKKIYTAEHLRLVAYFRKFEVTTKPYTVEEQKETIRKHLILYTERLSTGFRKLAKCIRSYEPVYYDDRKTYVKRRSTIVTCFNSSLKIKNTLTASKLNQKHLITQNHTICKNKL